MAPPADDKPSLETLLFRTGLCAAAAMLLAIAYPIFIGQVYVDSDLGLFHLPFRQFYAENLAAGQSFIWAPQQFNGFHLHGEGQLALYHPLNLISYWLLPLQVAFNLELLRNYVFLLVGTGWLARRWGLRRDASMMAALLFAFSGFNLLHFMHLNVIAIVAHIPFGLVAIDHALRDRNARKRAAATCALSLLTASQLLFGHPQFTWLSLFVEAMYALWLALREGNARRLAGLALAQALAFGIAAIQLLPQWESLQGSVRAAPAGKFAHSMSVHPLRLSQFFSPYLFAERSTQDWEAAELVSYSGAIAPLLLAWLWIRRRSLGRHRLPAIVVLSFAAVMILVSIGHYGLLYDLIARIPVVGLFRGPGRYMMLAQMALALACAIAFLDLARTTERGPIPKWCELRPLFAPLAIALLVCLGWMSWPRFAPGSPWSSILAGPLLIAAGLPILALGTLLVSASARGSRAALVALVLFVVADQASFGLSYLWRTAPTTIDRYIASHARPPMQDGHRVLVMKPSAMMRGIHSANGYVAMTPKRQLHIEPGGMVGRPSDSMTAAMRLSGAPVGHRPGLWKAGAATPSLCAFRFADVAQHRTERTGHAHRPRNDGPRRERTRAGRG